MNSDDDTNKESFYQDLEQAFSTSSTESEERSARAKPLRRYFAHGFALFMTLGFVVLVVVVYRGLSPSDTKTDIKDEITQASTDKPEKEQEKEQEEIQQETLTESEAIPQQDRFLAILKRRLDPKSGEETEIETQDDTPKKEEELSQEILEVGQEDSNSALKSEPIDEFEQEDSNSAFQSKLINQDHQSVLREETHQQLSEQSALESLTTSVEDVQSGKKKIYTVQLAAHERQLQAETHWDILLARYPQWLDGLTPRIVKDASREYYRLRVGHYFEKSGAESLCAQLQDSGESCFIVESRIED